MTTTSNEDDDEVTPHQHQCHTTLTPPPPQWRPKRCWQCLLGHRWVFFTRFVFYLLPVYLNVISYIRQDLPPLPPYHHLINVSGRVHHSQWPRQSSTPYHPLTTCFNTPLPPPTMTMQQPLTTPTLTDWGSRHVSSPGMFFFIVFLFLPHQQQPQNPPTWTQDASDVSWVPDMFFNNILYMY